MSGSSAVDLRVLGPVELWYAARQLQLSRRQPRHILGVLALHANRVVTAERLISLLWGADPPRNARAVLQTRVSEIRTALILLAPPAEQLQLASQGAGYLLRTAPETVDSNRFLELGRGARAATSLHQADERLRAALALWRGPVLGAIAGSQLWAALGQPLESARLTTVEDLLTVELHGGDPQAVADRAVGESLANPARERLVILALRALHAAGRTTQALRHYEQWRRWLREELGVDPAGEIRRLHLALVRGDRELPRDPDDSFAALAPTAAAVPAGPPAVEEAPVGFRATVANTLPADISDFTGRVAEADLIRGLLIGQRPDHVAVIAVSGRGGVGKTALSVHVAHRLRHVFVDGQLYANLRGIEEDEPASPLEVLGRFLRALGVEGGSIPDGIEERTDLYRSLLANQRVLVVLDNAADDEQLLPLIPGGPGCAVIVTSRRRLGAALGAVTIPLDVLDPPHASALLSVVAGADRVAAELEAAAELCAQCGFLPLAIRVAGAKLAAKPHWSVQRLVAMLKDERGRLDQFSHGQLDVRASIELSYRELDDGARTLLRRLTDLDIHEYPVWLAAAALDTELSTAEALCEQLFDAQLLDIAGTDQNGQPRFRMHDLVRLFAREQAHALDTAAELQASPQRIAGALLYLIRVAARPLQDGVRLDVTGPATTWNLPLAAAEALVGDPMRWFEREYHSIALIARRAARLPEPGVCWELVAASSIFFEMAREFEQWQQLLEEAMQVIRATGDQLGEAATRNNLGIAAVDHGDYAGAKAHLEAAHELFAALGERGGQSCALLGLGNVERHFDHNDRAREYYAAARPLLAELGNRNGIAFVLRSLGQLALRDNALDEADEYFDRALWIYRDTGNQAAEAPALLWQGRLRLLQDRVPEAEALCRAALTIARSLGDKPGVAMCLHGIGMCLLRQGERQQARAVLSEALQLLRQPRPTMMENLVRTALAAT